MRFKTLLLFCMFAHYSTIHAATPVSSIGSNPNYSWNLFPQDILQWQGNYMFIYPHYQKNPWWGDIDEPTNKPSTGDYTITGSEIVDGRGSFKYSSAMHTVGQNIGYVYHLRKNLVGSLDLDYTLDALRNRVNGDMTGDSLYTTVTHGKIPFDYSLRHTLNRFKLQGMLSSTIRNIPIGIKLNVLFQNTVALNNELTFSKLNKIDNTRYDTTYTTYSADGNDARALWGWSTRGCNHVFGVRNTQGDAWLQQEYAIGPLFQLALQAGFTLPKIKAGLTYRHKSGHQDQYSWKPDSSITMFDSALSRNFIGEYQKSKWNRVQQAWETSIYGNINWLKGKRYAVNTFALIQYHDSSSGDALSENLDIQNDSKEAIRSIIAEFDPNINIILGESLNFIDAALRLEYRYSRYSNTFERWVAGGTVKTYWNTDVQEQSDETIWENFSYANENSFHIGADINMMFPLLRKTKHNLGLGLGVSPNLRYTFQTKHFGTNSDNGSKNTFTVNDLRKNSKREIWFNTSLQLHLIRAPFQIRLEVTEPVLYQLQPRTRTINEDSKAVYYDHKKSPQWISQNGMGIALYGSYDLVLPFLKNRSVVNNH